jgi:hypothetical protein
MLVQCIIFIVMYSPFEVWFRIWLTAFISSDSGGERLRLLAGRRRVYRPRDKPRELDDRV